MLFYKKLKKHHPRDIGGPRDTHDNLRKYDVDSRCHGNGAQNYIHQNIGLSLVDSLHFLP